MHFVRFDYSASGLGATELELRGSDLSKLLLEILEVSECADDLAWTVMAPE